ncbi:MAG TPA: DUF2652 domain-containing protein [Candidatus Limnocylindria bacterium]
MVTDLSPRADEGYLIVADIAGYTSWMEAVGAAHGFDVSVEIPPAFALLGLLLDLVAEGLADRFKVEELEGDAVFGVAPTGDLDGRGDVLVDELRVVYARFLAHRDKWHQTTVASGHICSACPFVTALDLKMIVHEGPFVRQSVRGQATVVGPAVNVVHRLLKNTVADQVGHRHYLLLTDAAAERLGMADAGVAHRETYPGVGEIGGRVLGLDGAV